jgi:hypothetical protein
MKLIARWSLCLALGVSALAACGCSSTAQVESRSTTVGQELQDLEEARNKGLITEEEYQKQRQAIMKRK